MVRTWTAGENCIAIVKLGYADMILAGMVGVMRETRRIYRKYQSMHGEPDDVGWQRHISGAIGERVLSMHQQIYWPAVEPHDDWGHPDVGSYGVRIVMNRWNKYWLRLYKKDDSERRYYLIVPADTDSSFVIRGWMDGHNAKQPQYWGNPLGNSRPPAYFVPEGDLSIE